MLKQYYKDYLLIDTSALIAIHNNHDQYHKQAKSFFDNNVNDFKWFVVNITSHETFTRMRYSTRRFDYSLNSYDFARSEQFDVISFDVNDEEEAKKLLEKYKDQMFSFHDALCAHLMKKNNIYQIFSFDSDFNIMGFSVLPSIYKL